MYTRHVKRRHIMYLYLEEHFFVFTFLVLLGYFCLCLVLFCMVGYTSTIRTQDDIDVYRMVIVRARSLAVMVVTHGIPLPLLYLFQVFVSKVLSNCTDFLVLVIVGLSKSPLLV